MENLSEKVNAALVIAREKAQADLDKIYNYKASVGWKEIDDKWSISLRLNISGLNGSMRYTFIKGLTQLVEVSFGDKYGQKWVGYAYCIYYKDGYTNCNTKDIHAYTLQYSCHAVNTGNKFEGSYEGDVSGWGRGITKAEHKKFAPYMGDTIPDVTGGCYITLNDELKGYEREESTLRYRTPNMSDADKEIRYNQIKQRQLEIFRGVIEAL